MERTDAEGVSPTPDPDGLPPNRSRSRREVLVSWAVGAFEFLRSAALVLVFFYLVRSFVVEAFKIPTSSMEGTLLAGDFLLVNKAVYGSEIPGTSLFIPALATPRRGEIIVFHPPHEPEKYYVKRLLGLPGDILEMRDKRLIVNGMELEEPYVRYQDLHGDAFYPGMVWQKDHLVGSASRSRYRPSRDNWGPLLVPAEHLFVLGDNRDNSEDSRYWGFVDTKSVRGRPWVVYFSSEPNDTGALDWLQHVRWERIGGVIH